MKKTSSLLICTLVVTLLGCASKPMRLTQTDLEDARLSNYQKLPRVTQSASGFILLGIIPIGMTGREMKARNAILEKSGGDDIIDPEIYSSFSWTPIGGFYRVTIAATPIKKR